MRERPLSPHLQVYRLPLTVVLSILHRISGALLGLGLIVLVLWLIVMATDVQAYQRMHDCFGSWVGQILLILWTGALYFHLCNGVRHLFWDAGYGFALTTVDVTAIAAILFTVLLTAATWILIFLERTT